MHMADKIIMRPLEALIPYACNARTHSDAQVAQIAGSIREFGFTNPILLDGEASSPATAGCSRRASNRDFVHGHANGCYRLGAVVGAETVTLPPRKRRIPRRSRGASGTAPGDYG